MLSATKNTAAAGKGAVRQPTWRDVYVSADEVAAPNLRSWALARPGMEEPAMRAAGTSGQDGDAERDLVGELGRAVVRRAGPEELELFAEAEADYFRDPGPVLTRISMQLLRPPHCSIDRSGVEQAFHP